MQSLASIPEFRDFVETVKGYLDGDIDYMTVYNSAIGLRQDARTRGIKGPVRELAEEIADAADKCRHEWGFSQPINIEADRRKFRLWLADVVA